MKTKWTSFMDMHSGGSQKEKRAYIYIEAPLEQAKLIFQNKFGHNPDRVTCTCCGPDYSFSENNSLEQITAFERGCKYDKKKNKYVKEQGDRNKYVPLEKYIKSKTILIIYKKNIKPSWLEGELRDEGYIRHD